MKFRRGLVSFLLILSLVFQFPLQGILAASEEMTKMETTTSAEMEDAPTGDEEMPEEEEDVENDVSPIEQAEEEETVPVGTVEDTSTTAKDTMVFQQVTNINQITSGNNYIIKVPEQNYVLPVNTEDAQSVQGVELQANQMVSGDTEQIAVNISNGVPNYVFNFTLPSSPSGNSHFTVSNGDYRLRLGAGSSELYPLFNTGASGNIVFYQSPDSYNFTVYNYNSNESSKVRLLEYTTSGMFTTFYAYKNDSSNINPEYPIFVFEIWKEVAPSTVTFQRISSPTQIVNGAQYLIRVPQTDYVLTTSNATGMSVTAAEVPVAEDIIGSPQQITTEFGFDLPGYIFTITTNGDNYSLSNSGNYLSLSSPDSLFTITPSTIQIEQPNIWAPSGFNLVSQTDTEGYDYLFYTAAGNQAGTFGSKSLEQSSTPDNGYVFELWINTASYIPNTPQEATTSGAFNRFSDISNLSNMGGFIMTFTYPGTTQTYVICSNNLQNSWYVPIGDLADELEYNATTDSIQVASPDADAVDDSPVYYPIFQALGYEGLNSSRYGFGSITNTNNLSWYPNSAFSGLQNGSVTTPNNPFRNNNGSKVSFSIDSTNSQTLQSTFNLRGNANGSWLGYYYDSANDEYVFVNCTSDGAFYDGETQSEITATLLDINIYAVLAENSQYKVTFNIPTTTQQKFEDFQTISTNEYFTLPNAPDIANGPVIPNLPAYSNLNGEQVTYTLLGWTVSKTKAGFLNLNSSVNLYDYIDSEGIASLSTDTINQYGILGTGNPELTQLADATTLTGNGTLNLYAVYAVRGFDSAVAVTDASGKNVMGIADWKPTQGDTGYQNSEKEKWLGSINLALYKDGVQWGETQTLYFSYHNDKAADLNLKFIWDKYANTSQFKNLYEYLSFVNGEGIFNGKLVPPSYNNELVFPPYDQVGHYTIDGVIAEQGGSEDGLKYAFNWMEKYGGQLDNVVGESTVNVYVTSVYNVEYYLVDGPYGVLPQNSTQIYSVTGPQWNNQVFYSTPGTQNLFNINSQGFEYQIGTIQNPQFNALMNPLTTEIGTDSTFNTSQMLRGDSDMFSYFINSYPTTIPIGGNPNQSQVFTLLGKTLNPQSATSWLMFGPNAQNPNLTLTYNSSLPIAGTYYGTENTVYAQDTNVVYPGTDPYTFNLYAFLNPASEEPDGPTTSLSLVKQQALNNGNFTSGNLSASPGALIQYGLTVTNTGTEDLGNITVTDPVPSDMSVDLNTISDLGVYSLQNNSITWTIPSLASGNSITLTFKATVPTVVTSTNSSFKNTATVSYNGISTTSNTVTLNASTTSENPSGPDSNPSNPGSNPSNPGANTTNPGTNTTNPGANTTNPGQTTTTPSQNNVVNTTTTYKTTNTTANPATGNKTISFGLSTFIVILIYILLVNIYLEYRRIRATK